MLEWVGLSSGLDIEAEEEGKVQNESGLFSETTVSWWMVVEASTWKRRSRFGEDTELYLRHVEFERPGGTFKCRWLAGIWM